MLNLTMPKAIQKCIGVIFILVMTLLAPDANAQTPRYDLLLKGGHVIDPANQVDGSFDVAVSAVYVTPGLVDIHAHVGHGGAPLNWFAPDARVHLEPLGIPADIALQSGVTTVVDAGSAGAETF